MPPVPFLATYEKLVTLSLRTGSRAGAAEIHCVPVKLPKEGKCQQGPGPKLSGSAAAVAAAAASKVANAHLDCNDGRQGRARQALWGLCHCADCRRQQLAAVVVVHVRLGALGRTAQEQVAALLSAGVVVGLAGAPGDVAKRPTGVLPAAIRCLGDANPGSGAPAVVSMPCWLRQLQIQTADASTEWQHQPGTVVCLASMGLWTHCLSYST